VATVSLIASLVLLTLAVLPLAASAWNIPGHMLSAAITYQVLSQENPRTVEKVKAALDKHSWYANQWQARLDGVPVADHGLGLFMHAARWPDDIRTRDRTAPPGIVCTSSTGPLSRMLDRANRLVAGVIVSAESY
jgi:hypothetical protein